MRIGLLKKEYGWERVLNQEKASWEIVNFNHIHDYSIFILNSLNISKDEIDKIKSYLKEGGALLTSTFALNKIMDHKKKIFKVYIKSLKGNGKLFRNIDKVNIYNYGYKIRNSNNSLVYTLRFGKGFVIALPFDLNSLMLDERSKKIYFSSPYAIPKENVSIVSKGNLRRLIVNCFYYLCSLKKIPYIHLWYYPNNYESVFCYRVDLDVFNRREIDNVIDVVKKNNVNLTWFLSVINNKDHFNGIKNLYKINQSLQSHSYEHKVFSSLSNNYNNILKSNKFISKVACQPVGFASPFGHWNKSLGMALEKLNYKYSSEFSLGYDDMPYYPFLNNRESKVMQLPIYPICIGSLAVRLYSKDKMKNYFYYLISMQYNKQMPLFLYDHPNGGIGAYPDVFDFVLKSIKKLDNVLITDMTHFFEWWKKREEKKFKAYFVGKKLKIKTNNKDKKIYLRIVLPDYKEARIPLKNQIINMNLLKTKQIPVFNDKNFSDFDIIESKVFFSAFFLRVLFRSALRRINHLIYIILK